MGLVKTACDADDEGSANPGRGKLVAVAGLALVLAAAVARERVVELILECRKDLLSCWDDDE